MLREADIGFKSLQKPCLSEHLSLCPLLSPVVTALKQSVCAVAVLGHSLRKTSLLKVCVVILFIWTTLSNEN